MVRKTSAMVLRKEEMCWCNLEPTERPMWLQGNEHGREKLEKTLKNQEGSRLLRPCNHSEELAFNSECRASHWRVLEWSIT